MTAFEHREEAFALSPQQRSQWLAGLPAARLELEIAGELALTRLHERLAALSACHEALRLSRVCRCRCRSSSPQRRTPSVLTCNRWRMICTG